MTTLTNPAAGFSVAPNKTDAGTESAAAGENKEEGLVTRSDLISILVTVGLALLTLIAAIYCAKNGHRLSLAACVGALGGLAHEIAQSGGKIMFFERKADGIYIGSIAGMVLGATAGIMAGRTFFTDSNITMMQITYETFFAGLALKGVMEAAGGQAIPPGSESLTHKQALAVTEAVKDATSPEPDKPVLPPLGSPPPQLPG